MRFEQIAVLIKHMEGEQFRLNPVRVESMPFLALGEAAFFGAPRSETPTICAE